MKYHIHIEILINQTVKKKEIDENFFQSFLENFNSPDAYFMNDSMPEELREISILKSDVNLVTSDFDGKFLTRAISAKIVIEVGDWHGLKEDLTDDDCFDDEGEFNAERFASYYLGDWENVYFELPDAAPDDDFSSLYIERSDVSGQIFVGSSEDT